MDVGKFQRVEIRSEAALWDWLGVHHAQPDSVWLVTWKAAHPDRYVSRNTVLDALIAHGWIDGRRMVLDADRTMQLISPRKQQAWAQSYKDRAARLESGGRMHPAGRAAVQKGKDSGLWHLSDPVDALNEPDELMAALQAANVLRWWQAAAPSYRRNILRWIAQAKRPETIAKRIGIVVTYSARGEKVAQF